MGYPYDQNTEDAISCAEWRLPFDDEERPVTSLEIAAALNELAYYLATEPETYEQLDPGTHPTSAPRGMEAIMHALVEELVQRRRDAHAAAAA